MPHIHPLHSIAYEGFDVVIEVARLCNVVHVYGMVHYMSYYSLCSNLSQDEAHDKQDNKDRLSN